MIMIKHVTRPEQASDNIINFQRELLFNNKLNPLVDTLPHFRAWYAIEEDGKWIFGPSKFIGYAGLTAETYGENTKQLDGRTTEIALRSWFEEAGAGELNEMLNDNLSEFFNAFGKKPNALVRISILRDALGSKNSSGKPAVGWVEAMLALYREMPTEAQQDYRRRLKNEL
jgi:hypothetical protein